jgi:sodium-dependent dicarboxylate transporter 2/3/5
MNKSWIVTAIIIALSVSLLILKPFSGQVNTGLFIFLVAATLWISEAIHLTATALLIPLLAILLGVFPVKVALTNFSHPIIFIFIGGFSLAAALQHVSLDQKMAQQILQWSKGQATRAVGLLFLLTALLSMWVSNTAVAALMLPLALGMIHRLEIEDHNTSLFILLGIAYSASIGGMGTLVGSPPNAIVAANLHISFSEWLALGLPIVIVLLPTLLGVLYFSLKPKLPKQFSTEEFSHAGSPTQTTPHSKESWPVLFIFFTTVLLWLFGKPIGQLLGINSYFDSAVAIFAVFALVASRQVPWKVIQDKTDWGVLILFGGGLTLSAILKQTGSSAFIAEAMASYLQTVPFIILLLAVVTFVIFLTELTSNTATAALLVPLFISLADTLNVSPNMLALAIGFAASCAFMLPVATPPNAVIFGSGLVPQKDMMKAGITLNVMGAVLLPLLLWFLV